MDSLDKLISEELILRMCDAKFVTDDADKQEYQQKDLGLHYILRLNTAYTDEEIKALLEKEKIKIAALSDYSSKKKVTHDFIISYSNLDINILRRAINILNKFI